ncbi:molybdate ABC transporter substrate-binding protein [Vibrio sp. WJH972]
MNKFALMSLIALWSTPFVVSAEEATVAVANNFSGPMKKLINDFSAQSDHVIQISTGATGQLYAQIINGAPFDLFFSADTARPEKLVAEGLASDKFTYAKGTLVLWSETAGIDVKKQLTDLDFEYFSMANPKLAPYGLAAQQALEKLALYDKMRAKVVLGKGLNPTYQYIVTGNAQLGLVAKSQVFSNNAFKAGSYWEVPSDDYQEIKQDAVTLTMGKDNPAAQAFLAYLKTEQAQSIITSYGYQ